MTTRLLLSIAYAAWLCSQTLLAQTGQLDVSGQANIFGAGHTTAPGANGAGILPPVFTFAGATVFAFEVSGTVTYNGGGNFYGADGGVFGPTDISSIGGISGIAHNSRRMFLTGVFLNDQEPAGAAPPRIDFSSDGFADLYPLLDQTFFIGDGLTETGAGSVQNFFAPSGATRLFLGFADGFDFQGFPDLYADNGGILHVNLTGAPVPEPSAIVLSFIGGVLLFGTRKRAGLLSTRRIAPLTCAALLCATLATHAQITLDFVTIGAPGNAADSTGFGAVGYSYQIGKYEVTNAQYAEFLNAVAATDTHNLYNSEMGSNALGGITRSGGSGSYTYSVKMNMGDKPVNWVSMLDAERFANWMHNGQGSGSTETGAYTVGSLSIHLSTASVWIPTEDEWYKAAYYQPSSAGGDTDSYWLYPTRSNSPPNLATATATGVIGNPGANVANYNLGADWNGQDGNLTTVGSAGPLSASYYGTFDQGGNVSEWDDALIGSDRGLRGGGYEDGGLNLRATFSAPNIPEGEGANKGFRLASVVPEPSSAFIDLQLNSSADFGEGYGYSDTIGGNFIYNAYLSQDNGVSFLNFGDGPTTSIHLPISTIGTFTYQFYYTNAFANALTLQLWAADRNSFPPDIVISTHRDSPAAAFVPIFDPSTVPPFQTGTPSGSMEAFVEGYIVTVTGFAFTNGSGPATAYSVTPGASYSPEIFGQFTYEVAADTDGDGVADQYETGTGIYVSPQNTGTSPTKESLNNSRRPCKRL